jgi:DNA-binding transcriptional ArsR family regulator
VRKLAFLGLVVLLAIPLAQARMDVKPSELTLGAGYYTDLRIDLANNGAGPFAWSIDAAGDGLLVSLDTSSGVMAPHTSIVIAATVRAPPWLTGDRVVHITLREEGHVVDDQEVLVHVTPVGGLPPGVVRAMAGAAIGGVVGGSLAGLVAWRRWHLVGLALYTRLQRETIEKHPTRALLVDIVRRTPGISFADAQRESGLANGPFEHHVGKLRRAGRVLVVEQGRSRRLRLPESGPIDLASGTSATVAAFVRQRGKVRAADAARELALSRQALHYHVRKLASDGIIDARIERGRLVLAPGGFP